MADATSTTPPQGQHDPPQGVAPSPLVHWDHNQRPDPYALHGSMAVTVVGATASGLKEIANNNAGLAGYLGFATVPDFFAWMREEEVKEYSTSYLMHRYGYAADEIDSKSRRRKGKR